VARGFSWLELPFILGSEPYQRLISVKQVLLMYFIFFIVVIGYKICPV